MSPQQDARGPALRRAQVALPAQRGRVLHLVLRLLPARGVRPGHRHLHREGRLDQRGHRAAPPAGHVVADGARGRDRRRLGLVHLRPGEPGRLPEPDAPRRGRARSGRAGRSCRGLVDIQYKRNDYLFERGTFRVRGDTVEVFPAYDEQAIRIELWGDEVERISRFDPLTGEIIAHARAHGHLSGEPLRDARRTIEEMVAADPARARRAARAVPRRRASCWRRSGWSSAPTSTSR